MGGLGQAALVGQLLDGRFRIEHVLGEGGYGVVYAATDVTQGTRVALKVLRAAWDASPAGQSAVARFAREAGLAARLEHPNTVRVLGFGSLHAGYPFIAYELLEGASLERVLAERGPMPPARVKSIARQVLAALSEAHGLGIVHRDIKPANVFLGVDAHGNDVVKLLDFGVAAARFAPEGQSLTQEGMSIGTPAYMAPEQVYGTHVDARTDLYAVGLTIVEMLTGHPVFVGRSAMQVAMEQVSARPVPVPTSVLHGELGSVVAIATEKDASKRFASAFEMMRELDRARSASSVVSSVEAFAATSAASATANPFAPTSFQATPAPTGASGTPATRPAADYRAFAPTAMGPTPPQGIVAHNHTRDGVVLAPQHAAPPPSRRGLWLGLAAVIAAAAIGSAVTFVLVRDGDAKRKSGSWEVELTDGDTAESDEDDDEDWAEMDPELERQVRGWEEVAERLDRMAPPVSGVPVSPFDLDGFVLDGVKGRTMLDRLAAAGWTMRHVNGWATIGSYSLSDAKGRALQITMSTAGVEIPPVVRRTGDVAISIIVTDQRANVDVAAGRAALATVMRK